MQREAKTCQGVDGAQPLAQSVLHCRRGLLRHAQHQPAQGFDLTNTAPGATACEQLALGCHYCRQATVAADRLCSSLLCTAKHRSQLAAHLVPAVSNIGCCGACCAFPVTVRCSTLRAKGSPCCGSCTEYRLADGSKSSAGGLQHTQQQRGPGAHQQTPAATATIFDVVCSNPAASCYQSCVLHYCCWGVLLQCMLRHLTWG